jgi:hypothetical protein
MEPFGFPDLPGYTIGYPFNEPVHLTPGRAFSARGIPVKLAIIKKFLNAKDLDQGSTCQGAHGQDTGIVQPWQVC